MDNRTKLSSVLCTNLLSTNFYEIDVILDKKCLSLVTGFFLEGMRENILQNSELV